MTADDLRVQAIDSAHAATDVTLDLATVDHLEASTLQIFLALAENQKKKGLHLHLVNASPLLRNWFHLAGASAYLTGQP
jgi:anti-anti-sigma regulatory factor